jgi:type I restriction enzyme S subunit
MKHASEASAQPHLYIGDTKRMPVPIPPPAEQHEIVGLVDRFMAYCDDIEANLQMVDLTRSHLLEALLADALAPVARELHVTK